jgi:hypothetical protein
MYANRHKDIIYPMQVGSFNEASHAEFLKLGLVKRDIIHASFEGIAPSPILTREE